MTHQFIKVAEIDKTIGGEVGASRRIPGAIVVCAECGEVRHMYADGEVYIALTNRRRRQVSKAPCQSQKQ